MAETIDWPPPRKARPRGRLLLLAILAVLFLGGGTTLSYYVDALWFGSLGYAEVFWKTLNLQAAVFAFFTVTTFAVIYGAFHAVKPAGLGELAGLPIVINGQPIKLPVEPVLKIAAFGGSAIIALATGAGLMAEWPTLALYWYAPPPSGLRRSDPRTAADVLPLHAAGVAARQRLADDAGRSWSAPCRRCSSRSRAARGLIGGRRDSGTAAWRGLSLAFATALAVLALRTYLGRFERLFDDHTIFSGATYTDAHVTLTGTLVVCAALVLGSAMALVNAVAAPRVRWLVASVVPAAVAFLGVGLLGWYVTSFIVKPNELVKEAPYIGHNIEMTRRAYALDRIAQQPFPAESGLEAVDAARNQATLQNIRLWDWRALQDTLRQIQEIRTYYDFPDIDIDRYEVDGSVRQMMLATRELNVEKLPESSRNWINEKLIYTHGYGVTMNPVNGFTTEGLPTLVLSNMPVQSTIPSIAIKRPEIYFGELTDTDVYVKTRQKEFNYPQGESNSLTSYEGDGGIVLGGYLRRLIIALDRGDLAKLPFSDDVTPESRLLMRRNVRERVTTLAPFLTFDQDPYIVIGDDGRLSWMIDGFTTSETYPYARHFVLGRERINYMRNSVKAVIDAYNGTTTFYVFDAEDPIIAAYRGLFPVLFKDASAMPADLRKHVRYPELFLKMQAAVYGLYHMTDAGAFYNREDLWSVASEVGMNYAPRAGAAGDGAEFRADDAARRDARPSSSRSCRSRRPTATT